VAESIVTLRVDTRNAVSSLNNASAATNKLSAASKGATKSLAATSTAARGLGTAFKNTVAPLLAVGTAFSVLNSSIGTFLARERDVAILQQGLNNLGASSIALKQLQEVADKFGKTTLFNQEDFTRGFNLLTSFRNIGVDAYERVAQSAADIAQVNQVDVSTSFMQLAKALQDPERNLSNLNRSGIAFTKQQTKVIKELMKTNQVAKAHTMILDIVDESYNKLAQAAAVGFAGSIDTLGEEFRDFGETLGQALLPVIDPAVKGLTALLSFLNSEGGQATAIIAGITLAVKGLAVVIPILKTNLLAVGVSAQIATGGLIGTKATLAATSIGFANATVAANAFKLALAKTGIGLVVVGLGILVAKLLEANNAQKEFNELVDEGSTAMINQAIATRTKELAELEKKLKDINPALDALDQSALFNPFGLKSSGTKKVLQDIEAVKEEIKLLKTGLPDAKARDLTQEFNLQLDTLKKQNAELTNAVLREEVIGEEKKKEFDLEQQIAAIKKEFDGEEEDRLVSLAKQNHELNKQKTAIEKANEAAKRQAEIFKKIGDSIATGISDALVGAILQTKSLGEAAKGILNDIASQLLRLGINTFLSSTFGGIFSSLPTFANGGSPPVGRPSIVGEKGPELFVPSSAGTIIPSNQIGGGVTNNIVVNVDASGSNVEGNEQQSRELGLVLSTAIQAEIVQQKRPGGLLA
tara:strand:+ start:179 stop:2272 length:2094 start_codon:yes stop_codon:yes gene_type:complete